MKESVTIFRQNSFFITFAAERKREKPTKKYVSSFARNDFLIKIVDGCLLPKSEVNLMSRKG